MKQSTATIVGALILGAALVWGAYWIAAPLRSTGEQLAAMQVALGALAGNAPARPAAAPARGPDPARQYQISLDGAPLRGAASAPVTIVEFSDFQCPYCGRVESTLAKIRAAYGDKVRLAFKNLPLSGHDNALPAHKAALAAGEQGKFWEMHDKIFANQADMSPATYERYAAELDLDVERFKRDVASKAVEQRIEADKREAVTLGVVATPSFFINGYFFSGAKPYEAFKAMIDRQL
jgi:protein-disulfide isomerase